MAREPSESYERGINFFVNSFVYNFIAMAKHNVNENYEDRESDFFTVQQRCHNLKRLFLVYFYTLLNFFH